jgi:hypothetical protein
MTIKYANDLRLTELARRITKEWAEINAHLTAGDHNAAYGIARVMDLDMLEFMRRLNDIRFPNERF